MRKCNIKKKKELKREKLHEEKERKKRMSLKEKMLHKEEGRKKEFESKM